MNQQKFSILVDEWTDITVKPHLALCFIYLSQKVQKIVVKFGALLELESTDSDGIFGKIENTLNDFGLDLKNCI